MVVNLVVACVGDGIMICPGLDYIDTCIDYLVKCDPDNALYIKMVRQALPQANLGALKKKSMPALRGIMNSMLDFLTARDPKAPKISVNTTAAFEFNHEVKVTTLLALNNDMPYIVRSMIERLRQRKAIVRCTFHPILCIKRDAKGNLLDIVSGGANDESIVYMEMESQEEPAELEAALTTTYGNLAKCVEDGKQSIEKFASTMDALAALDKDAAGALLAFKDWVLEGNFTFLGYKKHNASLDCLAIGIMNTHASLVFKYMQYIDIPEKGGGVVHRFIGLMSPDAQYQNAATVPLIMQKIERIKINSNVKSGGHSHRLIVGILQTLPRHIMFCLSDHDILEESLIIGDAIWSNKPAVSLRVIGEDGGDSFVCIMLCAPEDNLNTTTIESIYEIIGSKIGGEIVEVFAGTREYGILRQYFIAKAKTENLRKPNVIDELIVSIELLLKSWDDVLKNNLIIRMGERSAHDLCDRYRFSTAYKESFSCKDAHHDIVRMERLGLRSQLEVELYRADGNNACMHLKVYSKEDAIDLSKSLPIIENMSMRAIDYHSYSIRTKRREIPGVIWIHHYVLMPVGAEEVEIDHVKPVFEDILSRVLLGKIDNSPLNKLALRSGMSWRWIFLVKALAAYLSQIGCKYPDIYVQDTMVRYSGIVLLLTKLFQTRFHPDVAERVESAQMIKEKILEQIGLVDSVAADNIMSDLMELVSVGVIRTTYYQEENGKSYIAFKIASKNIASMPLPKPFAEIFVYSHDVEGVHLRGGRVSRGGLRWSDRHQDYRSEVLGLMKAQVTKNSIIVPSGAKGGFVIKNVDPSLSGAQYTEAVIERYKTFLRGLLDLTDNIVAGIAQPPANTVCEDEPDPYLVVAADKGTATFSDYANDVSKEYNFWLGDAFASGGSAGYDHKKMGITAKGAWVSAQNHMKNLGINVLKDAFTVAGIGDMSGDVFGNGMLLSQNIKLLAAFNHMHIFLDPNPDTKLSYNERKRLFALPRSTWDDYDKKVLSPGAMVISRKDRNITLTQEVALMLDLNPTEIFSVETILSSVLRMGVDMIWNGGIGVYVKSSKETNDKIGDRANDEIRVNGSQVRAKMIVEGGNLGVTQLGRIEYSKSGGKINTDFIDNCGGVHCSDREVNIKIAFASALGAKRITVEERNVILEKMQEDVAHIVLHDNEVQVMALSLSEWRCHRYFKSYCRAIERMETAGLLDSSIEFLPNNAERAKMAIEGRDFSRPELAVIIAYAKIWLKNEIIQSDLPDDEFCSKYLNDYFPTQMHANFSKDIASHPLRREIIANGIANMIINRMGATVISDEMDSVGASAAMIVRGHIVVRESYGVQWLFDQIGQDNVNADQEVCNDILHTLGQLRSYAIRWVVRHMKTGSLPDEIDKYYGYLNILRDNLSSIMTEPMAIKRSAFLAKLQSCGVLSQSSIKAADFLVLASDALDIIDISVDTGIDVVMVSRVHFLIGSHIDSSIVKTMILGLPTHNHWKWVAGMVALDNIHDAYAQITRTAMIDGAHLANAEEIFENWKSRREANIEASKEAIKTLVSVDTTDVSTVLLIERTLRNLISA